MMNKTSINVGVVGASGISGGEVCRLLLNHPNVNRIVPVSRQDYKFEDIHMNLLGSKLRFYSPEEFQTTLTDLDLVIFCTPSGQAMTEAGALLDRGIKVIDLSADFRFSNPNEYKLAHGRDHKDPHNLEQAVYGVSELNRDAIKAANLVANPGCYVITALLGLVPILKSSLVARDHSIQINAINGTTGAGASANRYNSHANAHGAMLPYNLDGHRHLPELERQLSINSGHDCNIEFSTAHGPFARGIYIQASLKPAENVAGRVTRTDLIALYKNAYGNNGEGEPFIGIVEGEKAGKKNAKEYHLYPNVARVSGSNFCHIGLDVDQYTNQIKVIAVTDNIVKGAAGSAVQNMNIMFGFDEVAGLNHYGL